MNFSFNATPSNGPSPKVAVVLLDHRLTIRSIAPDPRTATLERASKHLGITPPAGLDVADVIHLRASLDDDGRDRLEHLLVDPLLQRATWDAPDGDGIEITLLPGVTDTAGAAVVTAARRLGIAVDSATVGKRLDMTEPAATRQVAEFVERVVANPVVERWVVGPATPPLDRPAEVRHRASVVPIRALDDAALATLSVERGLALDPAELEVIRAHFASEGRDPTDVELETLAQTWSEHCAHKTFRARITVTDPSGAPLDERSSLLGTLRSCTDDIAAPFVRSAFVGNAGVIGFAGATTYALKAETHNHPSAIEPFGGANTGVGGVIRDVLGMAHEPIAVTDILCFGPADTDPAGVPAGTLHPARIIEGVIDGVADYGNKIGLPTVAGAVWFDPAYTTNPLVFAGCIGRSDTWRPPEAPQPGDRVVVLGGRTGRDGVRGATFSSATMDATTGSVAGASVQIGDPITEKLLIDALVGAEHLYRAITDCGAGGLSSAVGEMAEGVGADVDLDRVPLKYPGLEPWEIWLSEAQERMVVAVPVDTVGELLTRCVASGVEYTDIGAFTGDGRLVVRAGGDVVVDLDTGFLHDGRPTRHMTAVLPEPDRTPRSRHVDDPAAVLLELLAHPNLRSRADVVHRYDHEIRGATIVRPLIGCARDAPADGVALVDPEERHGIAIGIGLNPLHGLHDPEWMAWAATDEAIRNVVAVGADPDRVALLDNFSFGDPRRPSTMGDLVAAVDGCTAAARAFGAPFVSGKDSLNNEYTGPDGRRHAVPPTLVITAVAHVDDVDHLLTPEPGGPDEVLVLIGRTRPEFAGSHLDVLYPEGVPAEGPGSAPGPDPDAPARYRRLHAAIRAGLVTGCHDLAEGGLAVAVAEMCVAGRLGARLDSLAHPDPMTGLFAESTGRLLVTVRAEHLTDLLVNLGDEATVIGRTTAEPVLDLAGIARVPLEDLVRAHTGDRR
ncbi:MAG: phosphoribosylformylglycinamidine synthase subunit PurS/phosphoribosylformylglycinamidine synthase [Actinomycetota bacterium]